MNSLESIVAHIAALPHAQGDRRIATPLFGSRAYLALGPSGNIELFFRGLRETFSGLSLARSLTWGQYRISETDEELPALVVKSPFTEEGRRLMAHVAYEARRSLELNPTISNGDLVLGLRVFLDLLLRDQTLTPEEQIGLIGELQFLHELLVEGAANRTERSEALRSWYGPNRTLRDFFAFNTAVEIKSSASGTRHQVSMSQLLRADEEETLLLGSVQIRRDASAPLKLPDKVRLIEDELRDEDLVTDFRAKLAAYGSCGYSRDDQHQYSLQPGFFVERVLLREIGPHSPVLRGTSFRAGQPPDNVSNIRYTIEVSAIETLNQGDRARILGHLVGKR